VLAQVHPNKQGSYTMKYKRCTTRNISSAVQSTKVLQEPNQTAEKAKVK